MRAKKIKVKSAIFMVASLLALGVSFQNCSNTKFGGSSQGGTHKGGEGFDGKPFVSRGVCENEVVNSDVMIVSESQKQAQLVRERCADLKVPQDIPFDQLSFAKDGGQALKYRNQAFDEPTSAKTTIALCDSPLVQNHIWSEASGLRGSLVQSDGRASGPLSIDPNASPIPFGYRALAGQTSDFDLTINGSLSYSILGASTQSATVSCTLSQPPPIAAVQRLSGAGTGSGTSYQFRIPATQSGHLIALGLGYYNPNACTASVSDNAPAGGNTYVSANAYSSAPNSGSVEIWYAAGIKAGATSISITLNGLCSGFQPQVYYAEFSGLAATSPLDGPAAARSSAAGVNVVAPNVTTASPNTVVFSIVSVENNITGLAAGSPFTALPVFSGDDAAFMITSSPGSYGARFTQDINGDYCGSSAAFRGQW